MTEPRAHRATTLVRNFALLSGGEVLSKAVGFLAFAYLARVLAPEAYGAVELVVSLSFFFALIVEFGLGPIGAREVAQHPDRSDALAGTIPSARLLLALVTAPIMAASGLALDLSSESLRLVSLFALALLIAPFNQRWLLQGLQLMGWVSVGNAVKMVAFALGVVIFVRAPDDLVMVGAVEVASSLALAVYYVVVQQTRVAPFRLRFQLGPLRSIAREGFALGLSQMVWALNQYLPTVLVATLVGGAAIGWFGAAGRIVVSLSSFSHLYHFNLFPAGSRSLSESRESYEAFVRTSFRVTAWAGVGIGLVGSLLAEPVSVLIFGDAFRATGPILAILIWTVGAELQSGHARWALVAGGRQRLVLAAQTAGAVATAVLGLVLIPIWGGVGAAVAMLLSSLTIWAVAHAFAVRHVARVPTLAALRPGLAAGLGAAVGLGLFPDSPWWAAGVAVVVFAAAVPVLEPPLLADARRLLASRGAAATGAGGAAG